DSYPSNGAPHASGLERDDNEFYLGLIAPFGYDLSALGDDPVRNTLEILRHEGQTDPALNESCLADLLDVFRNNWRLACNFVPKQFDGDMLFLSAEETLGGSPTRKWAPHVNGQITVHWIACTHHQMMAPAPLAKIGRTIAEELNLRRS